MCLFQEIPGSQVLHRRLDPLFPRLSSSTARVLTPCRLSSHTTSMSFRGLHLRSLSRSSSPNWRSFELDLRRGVGCSVHLRAPATCPCAHRSDHAHRSSAPISHCNRQDNVESRTHVQSSRHVDTQQPMRTMWMTMDDCEQLWTKNGCHTTIR